MRPFILALVSCVIVFPTLELSARLWVSHHGDALDLTKRILQMDAELGWKQRARVDTYFLGKKLTTDGRGWRTQPTLAHADGAKTVLILGPSSSFGWGVADVDTYPAQLANLLGSDYAVLNAGEIGYSSDQGLRLMRSSGVRSRAPDIVVFAYGVNDLDRHRFYFQSLDTDAVEFSKEHSPVNTFLANTLSRSDFLNIASRATAAAIGSVASSFTPGNTPQRVRVPPPEFMDNYRALTEEGKRIGARIILLSTVVHIPEPEEGSETERIVRGLEEYNALLKTIAAETETTYVDLGAHIGSDASRGQYFADPIHFSPEGNHLIAEALAAIIRK